MNHHDALPLRAEVRDRTGQLLEITAGVRDGEALWAVARPGHRPILEFTTTVEQLDDLGDVRAALRQALASQS